MPANRKIHAIATILIQRQNEQLTPFQALRAPLTDYSAARHAKPFEIHDRQHPLAVLGDYYLLGIHSLGSQEGWLYPCPIAGTDDFVGLVRTMTTTQNFHSPP